ncbi:MAG: PEP-CTERM sorting domain-containing protein [Planctomycetes bacterium]|nr:PEP-CTERM sorting domain-containing protein [Planctomycetota bacterium]
MLSTANRLTAALVLAMLAGMTSPTSAAVVTYAEYTFEGAAGAAAAATDVSGNGRGYVTVIGSNTYDAETRPGSEGSTSVLFATGGMYGMNNVLPGGVLPTNDIGFEGWFKATNASEGNVHIFGISSNANGMSIAQNGAAWSGLHGGITWLSPTYPVDTAEWAHLAVVRDNGVTKFFADGELITSNGGGLASPHAPHLAVNSGGGVRYDGKADDLRIFTFDSGGGQFSQSDLNTLDNLVTGGTASQSTSHPAGPPQNGIDLNLGNFTHTSGGDLNPSWQVVMPENGVVSSVVLNNRADCCQDRFRDIFVDVLNQGGDVVWTSPELNDGNSLGSPMVIRLDVPDYVRGKTVRVRRISDAAGDVLSLGEVQALGRTITNVAEGKLATQSSNYSNTSYLAGSATDGNYGNFTHTSGGDANASWEVDLVGDELLLGFDIESIVLHNRDSCCGGRLRDLTVEILNFQGNPVFSSDVLNPENGLGGGVGDFVNGPAFIELDLLALTGDTVTGRYVRVSRAGLGGSDDGNVLALGEVQVFGVGAVPEPSTFVLAGLGLLGVVFFGRRRMRK